MEWTSLELKVISCRGLKSFNFMQKLSTSAVIAIINDEDKNQYLQRQKTPIDRDGGKNPEWNHTVRFDLRSIFKLHDLDQLFVKFDLRSEGAIYGNNIIGEVRVPLADLIEEFNGVVRYLSYQIRNGGGMANGVLNLSYKLNRKEIEIKNKNENDDPDQIVKSSVEVIDRSSEKVRYPSLDDVLSPLPAINVVSYREAVLPASPPPPLEFRSPAMVQGVCYYVSPPPWVQTHHAYGYASTGYGCGQFGRVDERWTDGEGSSSRNC